MKKANRMNLDQAWDFLTDNGFNLDAPLYLMKEKKKYFINFMGGENHQIDGFGIVRIAKAGGTERAFKLERDKDCAYVQLSKSLRGVLRNETV